MVSRWCAWLLVGGVVAVGCGGSRSSGETSTATTSTTSATTGDPTAEAAPPPRLVALVRCEPRYPHCDCDDDADCTEQPRGECHVSSVRSGQNPGPVQKCFYHRCSVDADCGDEHLCVAPGVMGPVHECMVATCRTNDDCVRDGTRGTCAHLATPSGSNAREQHCIYPGHECESGCPRLPPETAYDMPRSQTCMFVAREARCVPDPDPVP